jgi:hypothetical protein
MYSSYRGLNMKQINLSIARLLARIPSALPLGMAEFDKWVDEIIALLPKGLENVPKDDIKFVIASAVQRLGQAERWVSKHYFVCLLHKAAASQLAGQIFTDIKDKQKAALAAQQAEVTAPPVVATNAQTPQT